VRTRFAFSERKQKIGRKRGWGPKKRQKKTVVVSSVCLFCYAPLAWHLFEGVATNFVLPGL
jgi:hypothetical protein